MMKHIKTYQLFEKMGLPAGLSDNGDTITDALLEQFVILLDANTRTGTIWVESTGPDYPVGKIKVTLKIHDYDYDKIESSGALDSRVEFFENGTIYAKMNIGVHGRYEDLIDKDNDTLKMVETAIRGTVYHELTHLLEIYIRHTTGALEMDKIDTLLMSMIGDVTRKELRLPGPIQKFFFLVYLAQAHEVSARVPQAYAMVKNIPDAHTREDIIKKSSMWDNAENMLNFSADQTIDSAIKMVTSDYWPEFKNDLSRVLMIMLAQINMEAKRYIMLLHGDDKDKMAASQVIKSTRKQRAIKNATHDIESLMHEWEGIIHRAGFKLKRKLSKVITAEL